MNASIFLGFYANLKDKLRPGDQVLGAAAQFQGFGSTPDIQRMALVADTSSINPTLNVDGYSINIESGTERLSRALTFTQTAHDAGKQAVFGPLRSDFETWMLLDSITGVPLVNPTQAQLDANTQFNALLLELEAIAFQAQLLWAASSMNLTKEQTKTRIRYAISYVKMQNPLLIVPVQFWVPTRQTPQQVIEIANEMQGEIDLLSIGGQGTTFEQDTAAILDGLEGRNMYILTKDGIEVGRYAEKAAAEAAIDLALEAIVSAEASRFGVAYQADPVPGTITESVTVTIT